MSESGKMALHPFQQELVDRITSAGRVRLAVFAPPGTGNTRAVIAAIERLVREEPSANILFVTPPAVTSYIVHALHSLHGVQTVRRLTGPDLRLMQDATSEAAHGVVVVSRDLARRSWASDVLAAIPWSLIFVDETTPSNDDFVSHVGQSQNAARVVAASGVPWTEPPTGFDLLTWSPVQDRHERRLVPIEYARSPDELRVRELLTAIEEQHGASEFLRGVLDSAWRSSASAFEFVLARQRNVLVHGRPGDGAWADPAGAATAVAELVGEVSRIEHDSKLEAFLDYATASPRESGLLVFTAMKQTALYLAGALEGRGVSVEVFHGSLPSEERVGQTNAASDAFVITVLTDAVLGALDTPAVPHGVAYDLPSSDARMEARWAMIRSVDGPVAMATPVDAARSDGVEQQLARKYGFTA